MQPDDIPVTETPTGRRAHYVSSAGWGILPDDVHAGDVILPGEHSLLPQERLVVLPVDDDHCNFCNDEEHVSEREYCAREKAIEEGIDASEIPDDVGWIEADYKLVSKQDGEVVAYSCHACISEAPVAERDTRNFTPGDVYEQRDNSEN